MKFKELDPVVVINTLFNGERIDARGVVMGYAMMGPNKGKVMVKINTVVLSFDEDRVQHLADYHKNKKKRD